MIWVERYARPENRIEFYRQPLGRHLIASAYHAYDMRIPGKVPGFKWLLKKLGGEAANLIGPEDRSVRGRIRSWMVLQDLRCYDLTRSGRVSIVSLDVTDDVAAKLD